MEPRAERVTLLAVHAHPDDEVIGTGGILARYSASGARVALVCATRGEVGEIVDPEMNAEEVRPRLAQLREEELRCACDVLGIQELRFLGYRDSGMMGTEDNDNPAAFHKADLEEATGRLVGTVRELRPQVIVTYDEKGGYGHPDHIMAHRVAVAAFEAAGDPALYPDLGPAPWKPSKLYYTAFPISVLKRMEGYIVSLGQPSPFDRPDLTPEQMGTPDESITAAVDVSAFAGLKRKALECHRSQIAADSFFFQMPDEVFALGLGLEYFVRARCLVPAPEQEDDLFAGLDLAKAD